MLPFQARIRAATADFFTMFDVPFKYGAPWSTADDAGRLPVAVITQELNDRLFGGANSVGSQIHLGDEDYRVVGVLAEWKPVPRFYDLNNERYGKIEDVLLPFAQAIDARMPNLGNEDCRSDVPAGWEGHLRSDCVWIQFWVELPSEAQVSQYRAFLTQYATQQHDTGRFHWTPATQLRNVQQWLTYEHVVPDDVRVMVVVAFMFLLVCLVNAVGFMLAKLMGRSADIGIRRALGASRSAIFAQFLVEAAVVGLAGGLFGLLLTWLGLVGMRSLFTKEVLELTHMDVVDVTLAILLATLATPIAGLYPTWRTTQIRPAWQLKTK
jgi:putative ABC transport system permease protein